MIHGLGSSPLIWQRLSNAVWAASHLRSRYQVWHVVYQTNAPLLVTRRRVQIYLDDAWRVLDPEGDDPARSGMVLVGHSLGGVVARMLCVDSGDVLWDAAFARHRSHCRRMPTTASSSKRHSISPPILGSVGRFSSPLHIVAAPAPCAGSVALPGCSSAGGHLKSRPFAASHRPIPKVSAPNCGPSTTRHRQQHFHPAARTAGPARRREPDAGRRHSLSHHCRFITAAPVHGWRGTTG